jgi:hypothetical protein
MSWCAGASRRIRPSTAPPARLAGWRHSRADRRGHQLADEVGISVAKGEDLLHVERAVADECAYGWLREASRTQVVHLLGTRGVTEQLSERVVSREFVVAVGEQQYDWEPRDPAYQEAQSVDGRLVGPVDASTTSALGGGWWSSSSSASMTRSRSPACGASAKRGPTAGARSRNGPSVRGVLRASQLPTSIRASAGSCDRMADTRLVLPMPASPWSSATEPVPSAASRAASNRVASS